MVRLLATLLLILTTACDGASSSGPDGACPAHLVAGDPCAVASEVTCFSSGNVCGSGWGDSSFFSCTCAGGVWSCADPHAFDGADCEYDVEVSCNREGPGECTQTMQPSGAACTCTPGGKWRCFEACYYACPSQYDASLPGSDCAFASTTSCPYPDAGATCTCNGLGVLECTTP